MKARRELKEKASHARAKQVGDVAKVTHERPRSAELLDVRDQFRGFDREDKLPASGLPHPCLHRGGGGPRVERGIELNRFEVLRVMLKPAVCRQFGGIEAASPMPIKP